MFENGDFVLVRPKGGHPVGATVLVVSGNQLSIAVQFDSVPPFVVTTAPLALHPNCGPVLFATRSYPDGPWLDMFTGKPFDIFGSRSCPSAGSPRC